MSAEPSPREERALLALFRRVAGEPAPHADTEPGSVQPFGIVRERGGVLAARHHPRDAPKGVVLFAHAPADDARIAFVGALGFAAMSFEHGGHGESDAPGALYHHEWRDALRWARRRHPGLPIHVWGVAEPGYFAHHALATDEQGVTSAIFEEVPPDLLARARSRVAQAAGALLLSPSARRWLAADTHAPRLAVEHVLYVSAARAADAARTARLAEAAGPFARHHVVADAGHREAWARGGDALRAAVERTLLSA